LPNTTLTWAKRAGGTGDDTVSGISVLPDGSSLVTGDFADTATFGKGDATETSLTSAGSADIFIAKYNADGTLTWAKRAGGTGYDISTGISILSDGSSLVTGYFRGMPTFGGGETNATILTSAGNEDIFIAKYNDDGTLAWAKRAGGIKNDDSWRVCVLTDGSSLVTGFFADTATFGEGETNETSLTSAGGYDIFIAKYNADGTLAWAKRIGAEGDDCGISVSVLSDGSSLVTGFFISTVTLGEGETNETSLTSAGEYDFFIAKYNVNGTLACYPK
jgi:uncharacterized delta-60 repeat protein